MGNLYVTGGTTIEEVAPNGTVTPFSAIAGGSMALTNNSGTPLPMANDVVPEPDVVTLLVAGIGFLSSRRSRKRNTGAETNGGGGCATAIALE